MDGPLVFRPTAANTPVCESVQKPAPDAGKHPSTFGSAVRACTHAIRFMASPRSIITPLFSLPIALWAQPPNADCSTAVALCVQQPVTGNNTGTSGLAGFCTGTQGLVWFTFNTNTIGGPVDVLLDAIDCPAVPGMDDSLSVVVLAGDGSCEPASFSAVSTCASDAQVVMLTTQSLMPSTTYWIVVAGTLQPPATLAAECGFSLTVTGAGVDVVGVDFSAGPDVEIGEGESIPLGATGGPPYDWSPLAGLSANGIPDPIASPASTTTYTVTTTLDGCTYSDEVEVRVVRRIEPPNTITPNGDGYNDVWLIPGINDYPGAEIQVHDRWGQIVYRSTGYRAPWDGTRNGRDLPVGTYYYHITLPQVEGRSEPYTGYISIVR